MHLVAPIVRELSNVEIAIARLPGPGPATIHRRRTFLPGQFHALGSAEFSRQKLKLSQMLNRQSVGYFSHGNLSQTIISAKTWVMFRYAVSHKRVKFEIKKFSPRCITGGCQTKSAVKSADFGWLSESTT
jgi:hypothetical protein